MCCISIDCSGHQCVCVSELQTKHDLKMQALRDELELRRKTEIHEIEEVTRPPSFLVTLTFFSLLNFPSFTIMIRTHIAIIYTHKILIFMQRKNGQISALMKNHEKAFSDIKNYYNDITLNNLALINSLKVCVHVSLSLSLSLTHIHRGHYLT